MKRLAVYDDFRVRVRSKFVSAIFQFRAQFLEIVNFTVKNNPNGFFRVGHRLVPAGQINDRKPPEA